MNTIIFLIVCVFILVPLVLLNQEDGLNNVILSTGKVPRVSETTSPPQQQLSKTDEHRSTQKQSHQRRHQLIIELPNL